MKCAAHVQLLPAKRGARGLQRQTHRATAGLVENNIHRQLGRHYRYQLRPNPVLTTTHVTRDSTHIPASLPRVSQPLLQQPLSRISPSTRNSSSKLGQLRHRTKLTSHPLKFYSCKKNNPPSQTPLKNHHLDTNVRTHNTHTHTHTITTQYPLLLAPNSTNNCNHTKQPSLFSSDHQNRQLLLADSHFIIPSKTHSTRQNPQD